ncbi:MAG: phenylacetate--CoA ligase family protein [Planctomycetes bacterium]|nr:phenylacetate--CoA ligase family protein [Planctomycetota bacterium]
MFQAIREMRAWLQDFRFRRQVNRWSRERLEADRSRRFRELVQFAVRRSPYYADLFSRHRLSPETVTLEQIPPLTKPMLVEQFDRIVTDPALTTARVGDFLAHNPDPTKLLDGKYYVIRTSGTSGPPSYTAFSVREWIRACSLQIRQTPGLQWRRRLAFIGAVQDHYAGISLTMTARRGINRLFYDCRVFDCNLAVNTLVTQLNEFQPQILSCYANVHPALIQQARRGRLAIHPQFILSSGEPLRPELRILLEETYQARVIDMYCASETLLVAGGSSADGLMLYEDDTYVEIFDDHWLATNLFNRTLPLIRYQLNDVLKECVPPRNDSPFRWIKNIAGRSDQPFELLNNDGDREPVSQLMLQYLPIPPVAGLQLVILNSTQIQFRILTPEFLTPFQRESHLRSVRDAIQNWLISKRMDRHTQCEVVGVDQLEIDPLSGKTKLILRPTPAAQKQRAA